MASSSLLVKWALLCFLLCHSFKLEVAALNQSSIASGWLELAIGLNVTFAGAFDALGNRTIRALGKTYFFPILSSPSFNSTNASQSLGFSFGFLAMSDFDIFYLAVCGGISGQSSQPPRYVPYDGFPSFVMLDGYVTPVWLANPNKPMMSPNFSLNVVNVGGSNQLRLQDGEGTIIWSVENAGMIEMQDTGDLLVYDSHNTSNIIWQSSTKPTSTLFQEQRLRVGMELTSNDSSYTARMESGGLVFYLNTAHFVEHPSPYWVFPTMFRNVSSNSTFKDVVSSPCPTLQASAYITLAKSSVELFFEQEICQSKGVTSILFDDSSLNAPSMDWGFVRLENDGRLYAYAVIRNQVDNSFSTQSYAIDSMASSYRKYDVDDQGKIRGNTGYNISSWQFFSWGNECDVPKRCGRLGVCRPAASNTCTCPPSFDQVNGLDSSKGCKRPLNLPHCKRGDEHINTTEFLQLEHMTNIFLFSGWAFTSLVDVDACKHLCTLNCSCYGFSYQADKNACFFITDEISLLNVHDRNLTFFNISAPGGNLIKEEIRGRNYITCLKVASVTNTSTSFGAGEPSTTSSVARKLLLILLSTILASTGIATLILVLCLMDGTNWKRNHIGMQAEDDDELRYIMPLLPGRFSYEDLYEATNGFKKLLGTGAFGSVYAGLLPDGRKAAVKVLASPLEGQTKQFLAEIAAIGHTNHVNVVSLIGFCCEVSHRILVYEYVERGSLDKWLFSKKGFLAEDTHTSTTRTSAPLFDWQTRYNVALGIARGLSYLHEECIQPVLHSDIKPQNILLDSAFTAKLGDFGMSRIMKRGSSHLETHEVKGTPGYIAPEWLSRGVVGKKCDVYSMGMVMLEIVGGRKNAELTLSKSALDSTQPEAWHFFSWAAKNSCEEGSSIIMEIIDERLKMSGFNMEQVQRLIYTALWCIQENPKLRPSAFEVVQWLEGRCPLKRPPFLKHYANTSQCNQCPLKIL